MLYYPVHVWTAELKKSNGYNTNLIAITYDPLARERKRTDRKGGGLLLTTKELPDQRRGTTSACIMKHQVLL